MRSILRVAALILVLAALLVPLAGFASGGPCPDDPNAPCDPQTPPFYVVINRDFEALDRPGSGCQPIILKNPDCKDCCDADRACAAAEADLQARVCPMLASRVDWAAEDQDYVVVYQLCCDCASSANGMWYFRLRTLYRDGTCPISEQNSGCYPGLPPGTGIDLPVPVIVGGLAAIGVALLATGMVVRRRTVKLA